MVLGDALAKGPEKRSAASKAQYSWPSALAAWQLESNGEADDVGKSSALL
jgi:hypothetical protein